MTVSVFQYIITLLTPLEKVRPRILSFSESSHMSRSAGPDFVSVYLDDILVFSRTLKEHMVHLKTVVEKLAENGLKLKPAKCQFAQRELLYLGHMVSREGLKTNPRVIDAV